MIPEDNDYATLAALAALVCDTPVAAVSLARSRQWLELRDAGAGGAAAGTFLRDPELWNATMESAGVFEIPDLLRDERYRENPFVRDEPRFRFYAGIALVDATGQRIGTLGALDRQARRLTERRRRALGVVGAALMKSLGAHGPPPADDLEHVGMLGYALELVADPIAICRPEPGGAPPTFVWVNAAFVDLFGYTADEIVGRNWRLLCGPSSDLTVLRDMGRRSGAGEPVSGTVTAYSASGERRVVAISDRPLNVTHRILSFRDLTREDAAAAALGDTHDRLRSLVDANTDAIFTLDRAGRCIDANAAARTLVDYPRADLLGEGLWTVAGGAVFPSDDRFPETLDEGRAFTFPASYRRRDGRLLTVECTAVPMVVRSRTEGAYVLATDVTERRRLTELSERQAARTSDLCRVAAAAEGDDSERIDAALRVVLERFDMQTGYVGEIRGTTLLVTNRVGERILEPSAVVELARTNVGLMLKAKDVLAIDDLSAPAHRERLQYEGWHGYICAPLHVAGRLYGAVGFFSRTVKAFDDADRDFIRLVASLISAALARRIQEAELDRLAYVDGLTELPNRAHFMRLMAEYIAAGVPFALHFIDLNDFKVLNDRAGHATGDLALAEVGRRLAGLCGENERPARLGGDEFVVVQRGDPGTLGAAAFAQRIVEALSLPYLLQARSYDLGACVGVAFFPRDGTKAESLMRAADAALYRAKAAGTNGVDTTGESDGAAAAQGALRR